MKLKIDAAIGGNPLAETAEQAHAAERDGYDGIWSTETKHDPFLPLVLATEHTERAQLGTAIAVAFARSPMGLAYLANDLQQYSKGRFVLGLGSQIKLHIEKRFSMPWSHPASRMRELILAMRAIWDAWDNRTQLSFRGDFYTHTLMTPNFDPGPNPYGPPKVFVAAVGERMTETAGEVADGMIVHGFSTEKYIREVTMPAVERGLKRAGRQREDFEISYPVLVVTGRTDEEMAKAIAGTKRQLAFYGSTPAYRAVLDVHGWGGLQTDLNRLSKLGEWAKMAELIDDDMLDAFAVIAPLDDIPSKLLTRYSRLVDRCSFYTPYRFDVTQWRQVVAALKSS